MQLEGAEYRSILSSIVEDGARLRKILDDHKRSINELADAASVTRQAADRWIKVNKMRGGMLDTVRRGLKNLGIDPSLMDEPKLLDDPVQLLRLLDNIPDKALEDVVQIIRADKGSQNAILALIYMRLNISNR